MPDGAEHLGKRSRLRDERRRAVLQGPEEYVVLVQRRQYDDAEVGVQVSELTGELKPVAVGQYNIDGHDVGHRRGNHVMRLGGRLALGHYFDVWISGYKFAQAIAGERLSVNDGKTNWHATSPHGMFAAYAGSIMVLP